MGAAFLAPAHRVGTAALKQCEGFKDKADAHDARRRTTQRLGVQSLPARNLVRVVSGNAIERPGEEQVQGLSLPPGQVL